MLGKNKTLLLLVLCNFFWAGNYVFGKYVIAEIAPLWITFSRWFAASFLLIPIAHFMEKPEWSKVKKVWPTLIVMAILGIVSYNMLLYSALDYTSPTNASLVSALAPGVMVMFSFVFLREKISRIQGMGIMVSLIGVFIIVTRGNLTQLFHTAYNKGDLLMVVAVLVWTIYSIMGKRLTIPPITATAVSAVFATIMMAPFVIAQGMDLTKLSPIAITGIVYMIIGPSVCSFIFWNTSVKEIGPSRAGIFLNLMPAFTAMISWVLGERVTGAQVAGGIFVFTGVYLTTGLLDKRLAENQNKSLSMD